MRADLRRRLEALERGVARLGQANKAPEELLQRLELRGIISPDLPPERLCPASLLSLVLCGDGTIPVAYLHELLHRLEGPNQPPSFRALAHELRRRFGAESLPIADGQGGTGSVAEDHPHRG